MFQSLDLDQRAHADRTLCSWERGWRSLLLRRHVYHREVDLAEMPATDEHHLFLMVGGEARVEREADGRWVAGLTAPGQLSMAVPSPPERLRWRTVSPDPVVSLSLHIPVETTTRIVEELWDRDPRTIAHPVSLRTSDPLLEHTVRGLLRAAEDGLPDLYAETAAEFVTVHALTRHGGLPAPPRERIADDRIRHARTFLRENLDRPLPLAEMAAEANMSRYHFLRVFHAQTGDTPHRYLTRLRVERARADLARTAIPIAEIAARYGFSSPAHFATAFCRETGSSASAYRALNRPSRA